MLPLPLPLLLPVAFYYMTNRLWNLLLIGFAMHEQRAVKRIHYIRNAINLFLQRSKNEKTQKPRFKNSKTNDNAKLIFVSLFLFGFFISLCGKINEKTNLFSNERRLSSINWLMWNGRSINDANPLTLNIWNFWHGLLFALFAVRLLDVGYIWCINIKHDFLIDFEATGKMECTC